MQINQVAFVASLFITQEALAADAIPPPTMSDGSVSATIKQDPLTPLKMGNLKITLEKNSLKEIQSAIGNGKINSHGDASAAVAWLCYTVSTSNPKQKIWLSSGEMGGLSIIDGITAVKIPSNVMPSKECPELPQRFTPIRFINGIRLGASENTFLKTYGDVKKTRDTKSYIYIGKLREYDVISSLNVQFKNHESVAIYANHVTSN